MFSLESMSFFLLESMRKFTIFTQTTMPLEYIQNFAYLLSSISLGITVVPWRNWRQWSSNISFFLGGGGGQRASWSMRKWRMAEYSRISYNVVFASLTASLNKYLIRSIFSSFPRQDRIIESTYITLKETKQNTRS